MSLSPAVRTLRQIIAEMRRTSPTGAVKESAALRYIFSQYRKFETTDQQICKAREEVQFMADTYLCYLRSGRLRNEVREEFHGKGERSIAETAKIVGFKLPHDPK